jgi:hypothetical protein
MKSAKKVEILLAKLMHEFSYLIDVHYENDKIAQHALEDSTFRVYRRVLHELRERNVPMSSRVLHVERRIEDSYQQVFGEPLPSILDTEGTDEI